ncbi:MAG: alpha/beta hydrolase [Albidovulum sp.]|nr:alpha/beta hydrolase [Albidovulum sp.]
MQTGYDLDSSKPATVELQISYEERSIPCAGMPNAQLDIAYGPHPKNRLDIFPAAPEAPALVFFHGGYWRAGSKESRRFPAIEWNARGVSWVAVGYRLLPEFSLRQAVGDACFSVDWLLANAENHGICSARLHLVGNSAGAHLAAMAAARTNARNRRRGNEIKSLAVVSGLFDLSPLINAAANEWLRLTPRIARELSPSRNPPPKDVPVLVSWGGRETREFKQQSIDFANICRASGNAVQTAESANADHFQIIGEIGTPGTPVFDRLEGLVSSSM